MKFTSLIYCSLLAIFLSRTALALDTNAPIAVPETSPTAPINGMGGEGGSGIGWLRVNGGAEVYSQQLEGCINWDNDPNSGAFYLRHYQKPSGGCQTYNYEKWFKNGPGLNVFIGQTIRMYDVSYDYDKELGEAWIHIRKNTPIQKNSGPYPDRSLLIINTGRYQIAGLSYDAERDAILFNGNIVAMVKHGTGLFGLPTTEIVGSKPTLNIVDRPVDDRGQQYESPFAVVTLEPTK